MARAPVGFHTLCVGTARTLARQSGSAGLPDSLLVTYAIHTTIS